MRVAVPFDNGQIFQHFGRTEMFRVYDIDGTDVKAENISTDGRSHHELASFLKEQHVDAVVCGGMGMGMANALQADGIAIYGGNEGDADQVMKQFVNGTLQEKIEACGCHGHDHEEAHACH